MKKSFLLVLFSLFIAGSVVTGCGKKEQVKKYNNRPEQHASWYMDNVSKGKFEGIIKNTYIPDEVKDKDAFSKSIKEFLIRQKSKIDSSGGIEKMQVKSIVVTMNVKLKNSGESINVPISMIKTGAESYRTVIFEK